MAEIPSLPTPWYFSYSSVKLRSTRSRDFDKPRFRVCREVHEREMDERCASERPLPASKERRRGKRWRKLKRRDGSKIRSSVLVFPSATSHRLHTCEQDFLSTRPLILRRMRESSSSLNRFMEKESGMGSKASRTWKRGASSPAKPNHHNLSIYSSEKCPPAYMYEWISMYVFIRTYMYVCVCYMYLRTYKCMCVVCTLRIHMNLRMCMYAVCTYLCIWIYMCMYVVCTLHIHMNLHMCMYVVCTYVHTYVYVCSMYVRTYAYEFTCMYVCMYVCMQAWRHIPFFSGNPKSGR